MGNKASYTCRAIDIISEKHLNHSLDKFSTRQTDDVVLLFFIFILFFFFFFFYLFFFFFFQKIGFGISWRRFA